MFKVLNEVHKIITDYVGTNLNKTSALKSLDYSGNKIHVRRPRHIFPEKGNLQ
jgi:hypothetical protein